MEMTQAQKANWVQILTLIGAAAIVLILIFGYTASLKDDDVKEIVAGEVAKIDIPAAPVVNIPSAAEIAAEIDVPDYKTGPAVSDEKKAKAYELVLEEMDDDDFREDVMDKINSIISNDIDDEDDIVIEVRALDEDETEISVHGETGIVTLEFNVYYLEDSDDEECGKARLQVQYRVGDLDRDNDYEDAEVKNRQYLTVEKVYGTEDKYCSRF